MDIDDFRLAHSETIEFCQLIEDDLKLIFSYMCKGDFDENYDSLKKANLVRCIDLLKKLDNSDKKPLISNEDYIFLKQMAKKRNYWCHQCYIDLYSSNRASNQDDVYERLIEDHDRLCNVQMNVESLRKRAMEIYKR